jgi:hypothetical protein
MNILPRRLISSHHDNGRVINESYPVLMCDTPTQYSDTSEAAEPAQELLLALIWIIHSDVKPGPVDLNSVQVRLQ